jgi:hypothetical protein
MIKKSSSIRKASDRAKKKSLEIFPQEIQLGIEFISKVCTRKLVDFEFYLFGELNAYNLKEIRSLDQGKPQ